MPVVGIQKAYIAHVTKDDATGLTFGAPVYYAGIKKLDIKPKQNTEKLYAEDQLWDQATSFDSADVEIELSDLSSAQRASLLGQTTAANGGVYATKDDRAPYVAVLYKAPLRGGAFRYGVIYKGAFGLPDDTLEGQEGKIKFQTPKLKATFQPTQYNGFWEYHVDSTDPNCPEDIESTWFNTVVIPGADTTPPTVSTSPLDAATNVSVSANIVWTFNEAIDPAGVTPANFFLMKPEDGSLVVGSLTLDGTGKIVTLDPNADLSAVTDYLALCTTNVTDAAGNALAATSVTNFTTAS